MSLFANYLYSKFTYRGKVERESSTGQIHSPTQANLVNLTYTVHFSYSRGFLVWGETHIQKVKCSICSTELEVQNLDLGPRKVSFKHL